MQLNQYSCHIKHFLKTGVLEYLGFYTPLTMSYYKATNSLVPFMQNGIV